MPLQDRGGQLVECGGALTEDVDVCCEETTCCTTHKVTSVSFLSASGSNCCFDLVGTYLPNGSSGGCIYKFEEEFNSPSPICDLITADDCFRRDGTPFGYPGIWWQWWLKRIYIEVQLENNDMDPGVKWSLLGIIEFYVSEFNSVTLQCTEGFNGGGVYVSGSGSNDAIEDCATGVIDFDVDVLGSTLSNVLSVHPDCSTFITGLTIQVQIDPL